MSILERLEGGTLYPSYSSGDYDLPAEWKIQQSIVFGTFFTSDGDSSYIAAYDPILNNGLSYYGHLENVAWVEEYPSTNITLFSKPGFEDRAADLVFKPVSTRELESGEIINGFSSSPIIYDREVQKLFFELGVEKWSATLIADYLPPEPTPEPTPALDTTPAPEPAPTPETTPAPEPAPTPDPTPAPIPATTPQPSSSDPIIGTTGKDKLIAKGRSIEIYGMGGNDKIIGSSGDDILDGGFGNDKIKGKKGADIYILSPGKDKFQGFKIKEGDKIQIDSSMDFEISGSRKLSKIEHDMGVTTIKKVSSTDLETVIEVI